MSRFLRSGLSIAAVGLPLPAQAECLGGGCYDGVVLVLGLVAFGCLAVVVLVLWLLPRWWRRLALWGIGIIVAANLIVPVVSAQLQARHMRAMEAREIVGQLPVLATRTPLIIAYAGSCEMTTCGAVLLSMGAAGAYVLPMDIAETRVLSGPLVLSELPLEHWTRGSQYGGQPKVRVLDAAERKVAADAIDYVIFTRAYHLTEPGPFDELLRRNPRWQDLGEDVTLRLAMAPLPKGVGRVVFTELAFDLVDLWSLRKRYAMPLFTGRWIEPSNSLAGTETVAAAVCPQDLDDWDCRHWLYY